MSNEKNNGKDFQDLENIADVICGLAFEDFLFAGGEGTGWDNTGISLTPGQTVLNFIVKGSEGEDITFSALPLMLIRRDEGERRLGIRMHILSPEALRGRIAETWYLGDTPAAPASFHIIEEGGPCDHVWEELKDGSRICFECDEQRPAEEGDA